MSFSLVLFCALLTAAFWPSTAFAYIDPGTGSILIQGIIAAIAAIGVTMKLYWHRFLRLFRRSPKDSALQERLSKGTGGDKPRAGGDDSPTTANRR